jgi:hypothetical protein
MGSLCKESAGAKPQQLCAMRWKRRIAQLTCPYIRSQTVGHGRDQIAASAADFRDGGAQPGAGDTMRRSVREQSGAQRSLLKRQRRKPEQKRADGQRPQPIHRSLDHVIGVRIPASQPPKRLHEQRFTALHDRSGSGVFSTTLSGSASPDCNPLAIKRLEDPSTSPLQGRETQMKHAGGRSPTIDVPHRPLGPVLH